uniref:Uncharacterized protein n=1 Tax=Rhipicephalus zambeziensis TaxID=60191 RepID=A0A224YIP3_9ACAR
MRHLLPLAALALLLLLPSGDASEQRQNCSLPKGSKKEVEGRLPEAQENQGPNYQARSTEEKSANDENDATDLTDPWDLENFGVKGSVVSPGEEAGISK